MNSSESQKSKLIATESNTYMTEDNELVAQKYAQLEAENLQSSQSINAETVPDSRKESEQGPSSRASNIEMSMDSSRLRRISKDRSAPSLAHEQPRVTLR